MILWTMVASDKAGGEAGSAVSACGSSCLRKRDASQPSRCVSVSLTRDHSPLPSRKNTRLPLSKRSMIASSVEGPARKATRLPERYLVGRSPDGPVVVEVDGPIGRSGSEEGNALAGAFAGAFDCCGSRAASTVGAVDVGRGEGDGGLSGGPVPCANAYRMMPPISQYRFFMSSPNRKSVGRRWVSQAELPFNPSAAVASLSETSGR